MFIVWGKKRVVRRLGHVADFCSICRQARPFRLTRVGMAGHLYYLSMGEGELVGFERTCRTCQTVFPADPDRYAARARKPAPLAALVHDTFPNLAEVWSDRLALEERVRHAASRLSAEERSALIREPFLLLSPHVASRYARRHIDKEAALALVAAVILLAMTPTIASTFAPDEEFPLTVAAIVVGGGLVIWQMGKTGRRFLLREVVPTLGLALAPLRPSHAEVGGVLAELARHGHKIGTELKAADVVPPRAALPP